ncbi:hypothetical protein ACUN7V_12950 [Quadrisphaera oryzae]|nr:hypothetical protein [Quadrisphaera sp. RL12-1S]
MMWMALALPPLLLPALLGFSRLESKMMSGSPRAERSAAAAARVD